MSRKVINILFIIGTCLYIPGLALTIWGYVTLFQAGLQYPDGGAGSFNGLSMSLVLIMIGAVMAGMGGIAELVARIGALIELGKAQEWVWFVLMIIFGWIVLLIYLLAGPKPKPAPPKYVAYPYPYTVPGQPWSSYPPPTQAPGFMQPPPQPWTAYQPLAEQQIRPRKPQE